MHDLYEVIFEIQDKIKAVLPKDEELDWYDSGMMIGSNPDMNTVWRDLSYQYLNGKEYSFCYSTNGDVKGDIDLAVRFQVMEILSEYKKNKPLVEIANTND